MSLYRAVFSVHVGGGCRFHPSCSEYAVQCFDQHNALKASVLTLKRLSKCHPFGPTGFDPVPENKELI